MTIIRDISSIYATLFSLVLFMLLFESRYSKKKTTILTASLMGPLLIFNYVLLFLLGPETMSTLLLLTCSLPSLIFFFILSKHRGGRFFFTFCFADTVMLEITQATAVLDFFLGDTYIIMVITRLIFCPLICFLIWKFVRPIYIEVQSKVSQGWYSFAAIALIFYLDLCISFSVPTRVTQRLDELPSFILLLVLMPTFYVHIFNVLRRQLAAHEAAENESILQIQVKDLRARIEDSKDSAERHRIERHDFRHKLNTISVLVDKEQYSELGALVEEYRNDLQVPKLKSYCNYAVLDAALSYYLRRAESEDIRVVTRMNFPDTLPAKEAELATVLANALENAINACALLEPARRYLEVIVLTDPCFMFQIRNSYNGIVSFDERDIPISARTGHGFGTRSIVAFCEKNNALYDFKADEEFFALRISFH